MVIKCTRNGVEKGRKKYTQTMEWKGEERMEEMGESCRERNGEKKSIETSTMTILCNLTLTYVTLSLQPANLLLFHRTDVHGGNYNSENMYW